VESDLLKKLRTRIAAMESSTRSHAPSLVATGILELDALLPDGGLRTGSVLDLRASGEASGAWTLGLLLARQICGLQSDVLVVIDREKRFYPPAAVRFGINLGRTYVVRPEHDRDAYAAACEALRCGAVGAVLASFQRLRLVDARRLQLAAERGGSVGLLILPAAAGPASAALRCRVSPAASDRQARRVKIEMVRCRGRGYGQSLLLEIDDATGDVRSLPRVADAAAAPRPARTPA
jgi:protein ImuA